MDFLEFWDEQPRKKNPGPKYVPKAKCGNMVRIVGPLYFFGIRGNVYRVGAICVMEEHRLAEYHLDGVFTDGEGRHEFIFSDDEIEVVS